MSFSLSKGLVSLGNDGVQAILMTHPSSQKKRYLLKRIHHTFLGNEPQKSKLELV